VSTAERLPVPQVRRMEEADLDAVMRIERESFSTPWSRVSFHNLLGRDDANLWVGVVDGAVVGYAVVWYVLQEAELGNLAVAQGWRRRGLGRRLLEWTLEKARNRGTDRVFLEVRMSNDSAKQLYERRGFVSVGIRRRYYRAPVEDARVMCLELASE
jgi:ribosomal-protein-alanine N-acetyltransferase